MARGPRYLNVNLPSEFLVEVPARGGAVWLVHGHYARDMFSRIEDGSYVCAGYGGSPFYIRCIAHDGAVLTLVDGAGRNFRIRVRAVVRETLPAEHQLVTCTSGHIARASGRRPGSHPRDLRSS